MKLTTFLTALSLSAACTSFAQTNQAPPAPLAVASPENVAVKNSESIAFLGDSITQFGADLPGGYVRLVISGLKANGITVTPYPAGISGHKSNQMLERSNLTRRISRRWSIEPRPQESSW
jgi:hypothetical protein